MIFPRMDAHHSRVHTVLLVGPECGTIVSALGQGMDASAGSTETSLWTHYKAGEREYCGNAFPDGLKKNDRSVSANQPATVSRQTRLIHLTDIHRTVSKSECLGMRQHFTFGLKF